MYGSLLGEEYELIEVIDGYEVYRDRNANLGL